MKRYPITNIENKMKYLVNQIHWDTDGASYKSCGLPVSTTVEESELEDGGYLDSQMLDEAICECLSDKFGYCIQDFLFRPINKKCTSKPWEDWKNSH